MKAHLRTLLAALACSAALAAQAGTHAHEHDHHGSEAPQKLQLNASKKWATDESLRQAMGTINQAMAAALPGIHKDQFADTDYQGLATTVNQQVAFAVERCKLEPKADAMLHLVIADLLAGAEAMEGKGKLSRHDGATKVLQALQSYGKYFQHPGWQAARG